MERERIVKVINHFVEALGKDDGELVEVLLSKGVPKEASERLVAFVPIAFGRVVIAHLARVSFTTSYKVKETGTTLSLSDEPIFVEALKVASEGYHSGLVSREIFSAVAMRSPELLAVNKALNEGADINGASLQTVEFSGYKTLGKTGWLKRIFG